MKSQMTLQKYKLRVKTKRMKRRRMKTKRRIEYSDIIIFK